MRTVLATTLLALALVAPARAEEPTVRFATDYGDINVMLFPDEAPASVFGFLRKVAAGDYDESYFHRRDVNFLLQGGGFRFRYGRSEFIPDIVEPVDRTDEDSPRNDRGTIAIARIPGEPRRATDQWFFNLSDNGDRLSEPRRNYTVFGEVADEQSLWVLDSINARNVISTNLNEVNTAFTELPVRDYYGGPLKYKNFIVVHRVAVAPRAWPPYSVPFRLLKSMVTVRRSAARTEVTVRGVPEGSYVLARQGDGERAVQDIAVADGGPVTFTLPAQRRGLHIDALPPGLRGSGVSLSASA